MKSFAMLKSGPIDGNGCGIINRYYIDGKRVARKEWRQIVDYATRQDSFHTVTRNGRYYARSICYI